MSYDYEHSEDKSSRKQKKLQQIYTEAMKEFDDIQAVVRDERLQCLEDRRFYSIAGAQWEGPLLAQFDNKPRFEVNKIHLAVMRIINEYRNNRITVNYVSKEGKEDDKLAETCSNLYRADEQDSVANEAYDNAFEEAVGGGFGAWRLRAEYEDDEDDDDERQRICFEPIYDADSSVFFDLNAKRMDKSDARSCYVLTSMSSAAYKEEFKDNPSNIDKSITRTEFDWSTGDSVYIAEYYKVEEVKETIYTFQGLLGEERKVTSTDLANDETLAHTLEVTGFKEIKSKKVKRRKIHKYLLSGNKVLEDCGFIAGKHIPIVPVYGKRWYIDNVERCMGHVRLAKDAQRLKNMQLSKLGEISALSSVSKPIFSPEQVSGHQMMWAEDNIKNYPYLLINPITDNNGQSNIIGPVSYTKSPEIPQAMAALLQITEQDMQDLLGNQQAGEQLQPNISGVAIELIQGKLDMQTFIYIDNMKKAIHRSGEIWLSMAKEILTEKGRKMKGVTSSGSTNTIELAKPMLGESGVEYENDLTKASFDVAVDVGPSSASKKQSTVRSLTGMMQISQDPETIQVLGAMALMNMEGEGINDVRDFFRRKLVKMGVVRPTEEEAKMLQEEAANQQPDANTRFLEASADQAAAEAVKSQSQSILNVAKAQETKAKTAETLAGIDIKQREHMLELTKQLDESLNNRGIPQNSLNNMLLPIDKSQEV